jgi:multidrug efflux system membrane fusion protein
VAQVAQDQAQIDTARANLSYTTIVAPIAGRTGLRQVDQGNIVHASDSGGLVVLTTLRPIAVIFTLPQQQLAQVAAAMAAGTADALALPQDVAMRADAAPIDHGTLAVLDNQVDSSTGTIKLKALFPNDGLKLWPGAFVTVRLHVGTDPAATVVPEAAVQRGPDGAFVYVVGPDDKAVRRDVRIGHEDLSGAVVQSGVKPGERVVVDGAARLTDGAAVRIAQLPGSK